MMKYKPKVIPVELYPADWCLLCDDPAHDTIESCIILTLRQDEDGVITVSPCGCTNNLVVGEAGKFLLRVTELQKE
jgi:hypothetical protein